MLGLPGGQRTFWGIPFDLAPAREEAPSWVAVGAPGAPLEITIPLAGTATYLVFAHFCNVCQDPRLPGHLPGVQVGTVVRPGEHLADYTLHYGDGSSHLQPIRRRFEINDLVTYWSSASFACRAHGQDEPLDFRGPSPRNTWGLRQKGIVARANYLYMPSPLGTAGNYWIYALPNPHPDRPLSSLILAATGADTVAVAAITQFNGQDHPLRYRPLETVRIVLPSGARPEDLPVELDLGVVARKYAVPSFVPEDWLQAPVQGWGEPDQGGRPSEAIFADVTGTADAHLRVGETLVGMRQVYENGQASSPDQSVRVEILTPERPWVHIKVVDATTGQPTPARIHFRSPDGRYWPPYGHRHEVNENRFEDYGGDLKLGSTQYAYIDGRCQGELPVGDVYVEVAKGFEYRPIRRQVRIEPGQQELTIPLERPLNWRARGWVTADTHVHFISPQTAWLEAQAEGVNLVNLLASQWGDLFTNVADLTGDVSGCSRNDTLVWVGTENRQHILGHISLLGGKGEPAYPMAAGGPQESYLGDPVWSTLAEWADACREREGLVIIPHFPNPYTEVVADIILGKVDALELRDFRLPSPDSLPMLEWYRFLNCGYRLSAVGGTDKMSAGMPVGGVRTYAYLGDEEFTFASWARAVRAGRTFTTSGPLLELSVEGRVPGDELRLPAGGGTLHVVARAESVQPFSDLQVVVNGRVVAAAKTQGEGLSCTLQTPVVLTSSGWIAARCYGPDKLWHEWPMHVAAHTSPVYVSVEGSELFNPSDAAFMMTILEGGLTWLDTLSIQPRPGQHERNRKVFDDARALLHQRWHAHGQTH